MHSNQFQVRQQRVCNRGETKREKGRKEEKIKRVSESMSSIDMEEGRRNNRA